ncbi:ribbon-helix-helix domain-containing protein [Wolbachia endosymbiont of Oedothorax gibbosus]|uniref:ribbon-helix-helix domain-containing protein n=1 Tax=Wolbachia endosymbiont of Oedothorax gibbosus TaxID=931100 RepID=UPI0020248CB9|nr:ribbon-helix-helix domain-containing protein [Wolbachia endosymbiont of Oedothorax gibbosus]
MSNKRIPKVSESRLDETPSNSAVGCTRDDQWANAFIKKMEQMHRLTVRLPLDLHQELRKIAFETKTSSTAIIVEAIRRYLNCE